MQSVMKRVGVGALVLCGTLGIAAAFLAPFGVAPTAALAEGPRIAGDLPASMILRIGGSQVMGQSEVGGRPAGTIDVHSFSQFIGLDELRANTGAARPVKSKFVVGHVQVLKKVDVTSPEIAKAVIEAGGGANVPVEIELHFFRNNSETGQQEAYYVITLKDARIDSFSQNLAQVAPGGQIDLRLPVTEALILSFNSYEAMYVGGKSASWTKGK